MESYYEKPSFTAAADNIYEVPHPQKTDNSGEVAVDKHSCNWKLMPVLFVCLGVFAVVASASLALTVWSVVRDRDISLQTPHVPGANNSQLAALQNSLTEQQNRFQDQLSALQDTQQSQLDCLQNQLNSLIAEQLPLILESHSVPSGFYYWFRAFNGSPVRVYMTRSCGGVTGGWTRVAYLQFQNGSDPCPQGFRERNDSSIRTCGIDSTTAACPSILFNTYGIPYSRVCGKVLGYQDTSTDAFGNFGRGMNPTIDSNYVDGVSLTHGDPRHHIWTFTAAHDEIGDTDNGTSVCPCSNPQLSQTSLPPQFVGQHYFCDSAATSSQYRSFFYSRDPLWDGAGCGRNSTCCSFNNPPWFQRELPSSTTDDIEMRVCSDEGRDNEDIPIALVEIYVQ